jgi:hypothetical protein
LPIFKNKQTSFGEKWEELEPWNCCWEWKMVKTLWKTVWQFPPKFACIISKVSRNSSYSYVPKIESRNSYRYLSTIVQNADINHGQKIETQMVKQINKI